MEGLNMAAKKSTAPASTEITDILKVTTGTFDCCIVGTSPLILNRMSEKAKHELLLPRGRKSAIEKATSLKHHPIDEYRASAYTMPSDSDPTLLAILSTAFKGALRSAALDMPGAKKAQIGRLTYIAGELVGIYGVPKLFMSITRSADMNKTPDVRTRAIVPAWACRLTITFVQPLIRAQAVANLLAAAGITIGVGDWRPEKGAGSYGQFRIADRDDPEFLAILKAGGRKQQVSGIDHPVCYDNETTELLSWYQDEVSKRTLKGVA
jgi:hypothetical protein